MSWKFLFERSNMSGSMAKNRLASYKNMVTGRTVGIHQALYPMRIGENDILKKYVLEILRIFTAFSRT